MKKIDLPFDQTTNENIEAWLQADISDEIKKQILNLVEEKPKEALDAFYQTLSFGTGGLRGIFGIGSNRINTFVVENVTKGLAKVLKKKYPKSPMIHVCIGFDSRLSSKTLAQSAAQTLAKCGIHCFLFKDLRPTPLISFAIRHLKAQAGIMITASHNPPAYNGYKVYDASGGQALPPLADEIVRASEEKRSEKPSNTTLETARIHLLGDEVDQAYINYLKRLTINKERISMYGASLYIHFSNLHGTAVTLAEKALNAAGFSHVTYVEAQRKPDGLFPTVTSPNPEEKEALSMGTEELIRLNKDILFATDPDGDRLACVINQGGTPYFLTGNQIASLMLAYILQEKKAQGLLDPQFTVVKSIATTELLAKMARSYNLSCINTLTGFKYIASLIETWEKHQDGENRAKFLFGAEESFGYLYGSEVRDKDAIGSMVLLAEVALFAKTKNQTLLDYLYEVYQTFGFTHETLSSISFPETKEGRDKMAEKIQSLENTPPKEFNGIKVQTFENFDKGVVYDFSDERTRKTTLPKSKAYRFTLEDQSRILIRPSGTEPKIKIYVGVEGDFRERQKVISHGEKLLSYCGLLFQEEEDHPPKKTLDPISA